jgi:hypothetical protein
VTPPTPRASGQDPTRPEARGVPRRDNAPSPRPTATTTQPSTVPNNGDGPPHHAHAGQPNDIGATAAGAWNTRACCPASGLARGPARAPVPRATPTVAPSTLIAHSAPARARAWSGRRDEIFGFEGCESPVLGATRRGRGRCWTVAPVSREAPRLKHRCSKTSARQRADLVVLRAGRPQPTTGDVDPGRAPQPAAGPCGGSWLGRFSRPARCLGRGRGPRRCQWR